MIWRVNEEGNPKRSNDDPTTYQGVPEVCQSVPEVCQSVPEQLMALIKVNPQPFEQALLRDSPYLEFHLPIQNRDNYNLPSF